MKRFLTAFTLTFVFSISTLAGDIPTVGVNSPSPEEPTPTTSTNAAGEIPTSGFTDEMSDPTLSLIQIMVGLVV